MIKDKLSYKEMSEMFFDEYAVGITETPDGLKKAVKEVGKYVKTLPAETLMEFEDIIKAKDRADKRYMKMHDGKTKKEVTAERLRKQGKLNQLLELYDVREMAKECFMCKVRIVIAGRVAEIKLENWQTKHRTNSRSRSRSHARARTM